MHRRWVTATATAAGTSRLTLGRLGTWLRGCAGGGGGLGCQCGCAGGRRWSLVAGILRRTLFHHRFPYGFQGGLKLRGRLCDSFARGVGWWTRWATVGLRRLGNALGATLYAVLVVSAWCDTCTCSPRRRLLQAATPIGVVVVLLLVIASVAMATAVQVLAIPIAALPAEVNGRHTLGASFECQGRRSSFSAPSSWQ